MKQTLLQGEEGYSYRFSRETHLSHESVWTSSRGLVDLLEEEICKIFPMWLNL